MLWNRWGRLVRRVLLFGCTGPSFLPAEALAGDDLATAELTYVASGDAIARCPDEESFRHQVAARLGYQPFTRPGKHRVSVKFHTSLGRVRGRAEVIHPEKPAPGVRELDDKTDNCEALASALATTVAIAIDPVRGLGPAAVAPAPPPPVEPLPHEDRERAAKPVAPTLPPVGPPVPARPIHFFAEAGGVFSLGLTPGTALGAEAGLGLRRDAFSVEVSARIEAMSESTRVASGDRVEATVLSGTVAPCGQLDIFLGCIFGRIGAFQGRAPDVVTPSLGTTVFGAIGLRAGVRLPLARWIAMQAFAEGGLALVRTSLLIGPTNVWTAPPGFGGGGLSMVVLFP